MHFWGFKRLARLATRQVAHVARLSFHWNVRKSKYYDRDTSTYMLFSLSESGVRTIATLIKRRLQNCPQTPVSGSPAVADCGVHLPGAQKRQPLKLPSFLCMWSWNELQWRSPSKGMHVVAKLGAQHIRITCTPPTQPQTGTFQTLRSNNSRTATSFFNLKAHFINHFDVGTL